MFLRIVMGIPQDTARAVIRSGKYDRTRRVCDDHESFAPTMTYLIMHYHALFEQKAEELRKARERMGEEYE